MPPVPTVFAQITSCFFPSEFSRCVSRFPSPRSSRRFSPYDPFLALCFGRLTGRESLRDGVTCLAWDVVVVGRVPPSSFLLEPTA